jgi:hypothetical protein
MRAISVVAVSVSGMQSSGLLISASGLLNARFQIDRSAGDIANFGMADFGADGLIPSNTTSPAYLGGNIPPVVNLSPVPPHYLIPDGSYPSGTSLADAAVGLIQAKLVYEANALAFRKQAETQKTLIDMLG